MTGTENKVDSTKDNLLDQIKDLQERMTQLESHALTGQDIKVNKIAVGDVLLADVDVGDIMAADQIRGLGDLYAGEDNRSISQRVEDSLDNAHVSWSSHFDGTFYPATGWAFAGSPFSTPSGISETLSRLYVRCDQLTNTQRAFYYYTGSMPTSKTILPYFYNSSVPLDAGWRWDDGTDNNYGQVFWRSTIDGGGFPAFAAFVESRTGGGAVSTTQITAYIAAGIKLQPLKMNVEGTQWSNWSIRPFIAGLYQFRWLTAHAGKTWTPTRAGLYLSNQSGSSTSYMSFGFDAFD